MPTYRKLPMVALDVLVNAASGALLVEEAVAGTFVSAFEATANAGAGVLLGNASVPGRKVLIQPRYADDGSPANVSVVFLRPDAANAKNGIAIPPTGPAVVLPFDDAHKLYLKTLTDGDGVIVSVLG